MTLSGQPVLKTQALTGSVSRREIVSKVSGEIFLGNWIGLIGANGSGKSTLLRMVSGLFLDSDMSSSGRVETASGVELSTLGRLDRLRTVAYVGSSLETDFQLSVFEAVSMGIMGDGFFWTVSNEIRKKIDEALNVFDLTDLQDRHLSTLSHGERQRVLLARTWVIDPKVWILDETFSQMDLQYQLRFGSILRERVNRKEIAVVWVSHDLNLCLKFASLVWVLHQGRLIAAGEKSTTLTEAVFHEIYPGAQVRVSLRKTNSHEAMWVEY